ncbi:hypothetical protein DHODJN_09660 [Methylorubrum extorquens]
MCGLCGYIDPWHKDSRDVLVRMADLLRHRGPDDAGVEQGEGWGLGFRRLAILDLSPNGHQPMSYGDGRFHLAFNGEIYNHVELRRDLEAEGERFRGGSDTEVLLRLLAQRGEAALPLLNGMFAFAFIDAERRTFLLARDRLGVKPLYYATGGEACGSPPSPRPCWLGRASGARSTTRPWPATSRWDTCPAKRLYSAATPSSRQPTSWWALWRPPVPHGRVPTGICR